MHLIFLGPPGSGKGTQASKIKDEYGFIHFSTGDLIREEIKNKTPFGLRNEELSKGGFFIEDKEMMDFISKKIDLKNNNYIFDGMPRTLAQFKLFHQMVLTSDDYKVFLFDVSKDYLVARLSSRLSCSGCGAVYNALHSPPKSDAVCDKCFGRVERRKDDSSIEVIKNRFDIYETLTLPIIKEYEELEKITRLDARESEESINQKIINFL